MDAITMVPASERYSPAMQILHWATVLLMFAVLPLAWTAVESPRDAPHLNLLYLLHESIGLTILALAIIRFVVRASRPMPAEIPGVPHWMALSARVSHWLLYAILFAMPVSGYLLTTAGGYPVSYLGLFTLPALPKNPALRAAADSVHLTLQWAVYALVLLHIAATVYHVAVRKDGLLDRELPLQQR